VCCPRSVGVILSCMGVPGSAITHLIGCLRGLVGPSAAAAVSGGASPTARGRAADRGGGRDARFTSLPKLFIRCVRGTVANIAR
jgi:hypothetical protein